MTTTATAHSGASTNQAWLTRLVLNPAHRHVHYDLASATRLHQRVMTLAPDGLGDSPRARAGVLFRLDGGGSESPYVLVQTLVPPDTNRLPAGYAQAQTRDMTPMLTALRPGLTVRYRLLGNAVRRCGRNSTVGAWKQVIPLHGPDANQWWAERAAACGLTLHSVLSQSADPLRTVHATATGTPTSPNPRGRQRERTEEPMHVHRAATLFEGSATIQDPEKVRNALINGIGRSKSYGCGLLSLAPSR